MHSVRQVDHYLSSVCWLYLFMCIFEVGPVLALPTHLSMWFPPTSLNSGHMCIEKIFISKFHLLSMYVQINMLLTFSDSASTVCAWNVFLVPTQVCALIARCIFQRLPAERFEVWAIERLPKVCFGVYICMFFLSSSTCSLLQFCANYSFLKGCIAPHFIQTVEQTRDARNVSMGKMRRDL